MFRRCEYLFIVFLVCLVGCHHAPTPPVKTMPHPIYKKTTQTRVLPSYNRVVVKGPFNVNLHKGYRRSQISVQGTTEDLPQIITHVTDHTLFITANAGYPKHEVNVDIQTTTLNSFTYTGIGTITGSNLNTRYLDLSINNPGNTSLAGHIHLHRLRVQGPSNVRISGVTGNNVIIVMSGKPHIQLVGVFSLNTLDLYGDGTLSAYWVKNDRLIVKEHGNTRIQLAGRTNVMEVELWDHSVFNGRYLRADRAFVKTHDHSRAELSAVNRQHTLASDASDIYFYNLPVMRTDFMAYQGAVLDMRDWNLFYNQEYTIYNK